MTIEERLLQIKEDMIKAKNDKATYEGKLSAQLERLKEFDCKNIQDAEKKIKKLEIEIESLKNEIEKGIIKFEGKYNF